MNSTLKFITLLVRTRNKHILLILCLISNNILAQFSINIGEGKTHYVQSSPFRKYHINGGAKNGKDYIVVNPKNLITPTISCCLEIKKNYIQLGYERNSIAFDIFPFQRTGRLMRSFNFSVVSIGIGRTFTINKENSSKMSLRLGLYGFKILNKTGVEKHSSLYFSPPNNLSYDDIHRETFSIKVGPQVGVGLNGILKFYPSLKIKQLSFFASLDYTLTEFLAMNWGWREDSGIISVNYQDSYRRLASLGVSFEIDYKNK